MKRGPIIFFFLLLSLLGDSQSTYSVCPGGVSTISITNSWNLTNVSYSLNPGAVSSQNGIWTVTVNTPGTYVMYITGDDQSAVPVTYSMSVSIGHFPIPNLTTVSSPQNFTVGCGQRSVTTIVLAGSAPNILSPLYTVVPMGYTVSSGGGWKTTKSFALTQPGQYMAMSCFGGSNFCYDTLSFWVTENKVKPVFDTVQYYPKGFLCLYNLDHPQFVQIKCVTNGYATQLTSPSGAISYNGWAKVTSTGPFTLTTLDSGTDCPHDTVIMVPDFRIHPTLTVQPQYTLCNTASIAISASVGWHPDSVKVEWKEVIDWQPDKVWGTGTVLTVWAPGTYTVYATNQYGCYVSEKVLVLGCVGFGEIQGAPIQLWPNPVTDELFVFFPDDQIRVVSVINPLGQELKRVLSSREAALDLSCLAPGAYFVRWEGGVKKVIKQ